MGPGKVIPTQSSGETAKPAGQDLSSKNGGPPVRKTSFWSVAGLAVAVVVALFLLYRLDNLEHKIARLSDQVAITNQAAGRADKTSQLALRQASQAQASAQQAAQQRDQARKAAAQSQKEAALARQQTQTAQNQAAWAQQRAEQYRKQREEELTRLQQVLGQIADTRRTAMGLIMTLGSNSIRFEFDKAVLRPENREVLSRIAGVLMTLKGYHISVYGYTDDVGTEAYNLKLSARRAQAVRSYLVKAGLDPSIINMKGYGKSDRRVPGDTAQARAINRRVEIGIVDSTLQLEGSPPSIK
ncbi:MAG: OmpA family protein [Terriglobia bacterium]